jgi:xanthine/CO dehydrogenase XdhC/CoxF family maturation factor
METQLRIMKGRELSQHVASKIELSKVAEFNGQGPQPTQLARGIALVKFYAMWPYRLITSGGAVPTMAPGLSAQVDAGALDGRTVICVLTHDPKFDVPVLSEALRLPVAFVGAMGSRDTHTDRLARLAEAGLSHAELSRLSSPIGLDLGARTPEETAISIAAEIIARRWDGAGRPLSETDGAIHRQPVAEPHNPAPSHSAAPPQSVSTG